MNLFFVRVVLLAFGLTSLFSWAHAQDVPTITVSKSDRINLSVAPLNGSEGAAATKTVQNDLTLCGFFNLGGANASYTVRGSANGGSLQGQVVDHGGGTVLSKSYSGAARETAHRFADDIVETLTGNKGIATTKVAFIATRSGHKEVYVADYDGSSVRQLTHDNVISVHPSLSPDGRRIAYTGYQSGYADVYVIDLASGARNRIVNFPGTNSGASFSPDGNRVAFVRTFSNGARSDHHARIFAAHLNGLHLAQLFNDSGEHDENCGMRISDFGFRFIARARQLT